GALDAAADRDVLRNDAALDLRTIADEKIRGPQLAFDSAEDLRWTIAFDVADDCHTGADAGAGRRRIRRRLPPRRGLFDKRGFVGQRPFHALGPLFPRVLLTFS